jgi:hypothetical protein
MVRQIPRQDLDIVPSLSKAGALFKQNPLASTDHRIYGNICNEKNIQIQNPYWPKAVYCRVEFVETQDAPA